jgi:hypothetical protein
MANNKSIDFIEELPNYANRYIEVCLNHTKEVATGSGKIVEQRERHIPTIAFFLNIWLPRNVGDTIARKTYYEWLNSSNELKSNTIKRIDDLFQALAVDIVANEGKGIFYAKNKLGMTDKSETKLDNNHSGSIKIEVIKSDVSLHNSEKDINLDV